MKMAYLSKLSIILFLFFTSSLHSQVIGTSNPSLKVDFKESNIDSTAISLEEYNRVLEESGFPSITAADPLVTKDNTVWLYYEIPLPEESEDAVEINIPTTSKDLFDTELVQFNEEEMTIVAGTTIDGLSFDSDATASGFFHIPPDPSGAVGTTHVCHVVNTSISCHSKAGVAAPGFPQSLANFFSSLSPENGTFDPKIIWDQYENRFVALTLVKTATSTGDAADISRLLLAVSATADPTGTWYFQDIEVSQTISSSDCWFDYPGFAVDDKAVYITGNYFRFSTNASCGASYVLIIDKGTTGGIYDGTTFADEDPATNSAFSLIRPSTAAGSGFNSVLQPAHMYGTLPSNMGTWLASYSGLSNGTNEAFEFFKITNPITAPSISRQLLFVGNIDDTSSGVADANQSGSATNLETNDRRTLNAVWRNDKLWVSSQVMPPSGVNSGQVTAVWLQFDADGTNNISLVNNGEIGGEDIAVGASTFFPSIAINSSGDAGISFNASHSSIFAGAYATSVDAATGMVGATETVKAGADDYVRTFGGDNRWGDYGRMALDPVDDGFWAISQAAIANGTLLSEEDGRWQVFIKELDILLPVELSSFEAYAENKDAILKWSTASEKNNYGFYIEQNMEGRFETVQFVQGADNSSIQQEYQSTIKNLPVGTHLFRLRQVDHDRSETLSDVRAVNIEGELDNKLSSVSPNPFSTTANFELYLTRKQNVSIEIIDLNGKVVQKLTQKMLEANTKHRFSIDAIELPNAMYILQVIGEDFSEFKKLILKK